MVKFEKRRKVIKRKDFIKNSIIIGFILLVLITGFMFMFADKKNISVSKSIIDNNVEKSLPFKKDISLKNYLPEKLNFIGNSFDNISINITDIKTTFKDNKILLDSDLELYINSEKYLLNILTEGTPIYRDFSFYFETNHLKINKEKEFSTMLKEAVAKKELSLYNMNTLDSVQSHLDKLKDKVKSDSIVDKYIKKVKANLKDIKKVEDIPLTTKVFSNNDFNEKLNIYIESKIEDSFNYITKNKPIYKLENSLRDNTLKIGLDNIKINSNEIVFTISLAQILYYVIIMIIVIFIILILIYYVIKHPGEVFFGFIEITTETLGSVADGLGSVADGL